VTNMDLGNLREWVGRAEERVDHVSAAPLAALSATLDHNDAEPHPGSAIPPLWHWLYFTPLTRQSEIGPDGHTQRGGSICGPATIKAGSRWKRARSECKSTCQS
jgi:3-methylfumaryl-CoA hydratase